MIQNNHILPGDSRYKAVIDRRFNKQFVGRPEYVVVATSPEDVIVAVRDGVRDGKRIVATSGGHCLEGFVSDPDVQVVVDVSLMKLIEYDDSMRAIAVGAGATVGETYRALYERWGTVIPLGEYPGIGMGGHVAGGAFGFLCRELGLAADYLHAVEVVTVDAHGEVAITIATRNASDAKHDLWWAHTGGGAGNFGIVTRYWFRDPDATGADPRTILPRAPESITTFRASWPWSAIDRNSFSTLARNYGTWCERNASIDGRNARLFGVLELHRSQFGSIVVRGGSTAGDGAHALIEEHIVEISAGIDAPSGLEVTRMSWLDFALNPFPDLFTFPPGGVSVKTKDALLRRRLADPQIDVAYDHLTNDAVDIMGGMLAFATYGGRVNVLAPGATASAHRGAIIDMGCATGWIDRADAASNIEWVRGIYRDLFAESGGVPVPSDAYDGTLINHPDIDLADSELNTSGVPWCTLYYRDNYARLQRVKREWDPRNVFRHALSVRS